MYVGSFCEDKSRHTTTGNIDYKTHLVSASTANRNSFRIYLYSNGVSYHVSCMVQNNHAKWIIDQTCTVANTWLSRCSHWLQSHQDDFGLRVHRFILCQNYMMFPLVCNAPPPYFEAVYCLICGHQGVVHGCCSISDDLSCPSIKVPLAISYYVKN